MLVKGTRLFALIALLASSIVYAQQQEAIRINCGGPTVEDSGGIVWIADEEFVNGGGTYTTSTEIKNTLSSTLLQSERYSRANETMKYVVPVVNGVYDVRLRWSENYESKVGARIFHVIIEGIMAMANVDIFKEAGKKRFFKVEKKFRVTAVDNSLTIEFADVKQSAKIGTISIIPVSDDAPHPDIRAVLNVVGEPDPDGNSWADSYSVGNHCYCHQVTSYDHEIDTVQVETELGWMTVKQVCEILGPGPGIEDRPIYNDVQCGNGPHNQAGDEHRCPGRVDLGPDGCGQIGPKWNFGK